MRGLFGLGMVGLGLLMAAPSAPAGAAAGGDEGFRGIDVVEVEGLIDPMNASLMRRSIENAEARGSTLLVFQMTSEGVTDVDPVALADEIRAATIPVAVWVGPAGSSVRGGAAVVAEAAPVLSLASNARIGPLEPLRVDREVPVPAGADQYARAVDPIRTERLAADEALEAGVVDRIDPVLGELIVGLDGQSIATAQGPVTIRTREVVGEGEDRRSQPNQPVTFARLGMGDQVLHTVATPWAAYFLFVAGGLLVMFEFFAASLGIGGMVGALCLVFSCVGLSYLPFSWLGLVLVTVGLLGYAIDAQAGGIGFWTVAGAVSLLVGSLLFYEGSARLGPSWLAVLIVNAGAALFVLSGLTAMIRSRFSTPTMGREGLVGEMGTAEVDVAPDGVVQIRGARWRARTNRATPIRAGEAVRVVEIAGVVLEVEPETGGAKDYRH